MGSDRLTTKDARRAYAIAEANDRVGFDRYLRSVAERGGPQHPLALDLATRPETLEHAWHFARTSEGWLRGSSQPPNASAMWARRTLETEATLLRLSEI